MARAGRRRARHAARAPRTRAAPARRPRGGARAQPAGGPNIILLLVIVFKLHCFSFSFLEQSSISRVAKGD